jgi:hypothetical protein
MPSVTEPLLELARDVRTRTLRLLEAATDHELTWTPPGTSNHVLWHAGHALWLQEVLCLQILTGKSGLPAGWGERFGMGSRPGQPRRPWPPRDEVRRELAAQLPRLLDALRPLTREQLEALPPFPHRGDDRTLQQCIVHGLHDEANHQGEMYLLLKMQRLSGLTPRAAAATD